MTSDKQQVATLPEIPTENGRNLADSKETTDERTLVVCVGGEIAQPAVARWYMGRDSKASVVYCSVWLRRADGKQGYAGHGKAGGYGYCKASEAFQRALDSAGVKLARNVGGVGMSAVDGAMRACVLALGYPEDAPWGIV